MLIPSISLPSPQSTNTPLPSCVSTGLLGRRGKLAHAKHFSRCGCAKHLISREIYVARFKCFIGFQLCQGGRWGYTGWWWKGEKLIKMGIKGGGRGRWYKKQGNVQVGWIRSSKGRCFCLIIEEKKHSIKIKPLPRNLKLMKLIRKIQRVCQKNWVVDIKAWHNDKGFSRNQWYFLLDALASLEFMLSVINDNQWRSMIINDNQW